MPTNSSVSSACCLRIIAYSLFCRRCRTNRIERSHPARIDPERLLIGDSMEHLRRNLDVSKTSLEIFEVIEFKAGTRGTPISSMLFLSISLATTSA